MRCAFLQRPHPFPFSASQLRASLTSPPPRPPLPFRTSTVRDMSHRAFQLHLDPLTGNSEWIVVDEVEDEEPQANPKSMLAATSYLDMLNDSHRNSAFARAIGNTITRPCNVLDIGAGTGLLSMMAARAMEGIGGTVTACESYLPMGKLTRKVLRRNGMEGKVRLVHKRSDEMVVGVDMDSRADVLVSEILDSELLGEGLIPTLQHAHDYLLVGNPLTVPYRATFYAQLVESTFLWKLHDLYSCEAQAGDDVHLVPSIMDRIITINPKQYAMQCGAISSEIKLMSEPFEVFDFDFSRRPESQGQVDLQVTVKDSGTIHAIISWWVLQLDSSGSIFYSLSPEWITNMNNETEGKFNSGNKGWCDHWKKCIWFVPGRGIPVCKDFPVSFKAMHDSTSISYRLETVDHATKHQHNDHEIGYSQLMLSPERIGLYGVDKWRSAFLSAIKIALAAKCSQYCLVADDSVFLTMAMVHLSRTRVLSAFPGLREKARNYLDLVADVSQFPKDQVEVLGKWVSFLAGTDLHQQKFDMLIAEPFYYGNEGALPWQNLRFWKERTLLDSLLTEDAYIMPCKGVLKACAMSLPDLWRSRCCLKNVEGFDHSDVNETLGACGYTKGPCLPYFVWQCGETKDLSEVFPVMEFDMLQPIHTCSGKAKVTFSNSGICHGFVLWIDWVLDRKSSITISTGPDSRYWKQGVKLLSEPVPVKTPSSNVGNCYAEIEASFDALTGDLDVKTHLFA